MSKFAIFFSLKGEAVKAMMDRPSDREKVVGDLLAGVGGKLEAYYWMFGPFDGFAVCDVPDSTTAAAVSIAVSGSGAFAHVETHELIPAAALKGILEKAKGLTYSAPGS